MAGGGGGQSPGLVGGVGAPPASAQPLSPAAMGGTGAPAGGTTLPSFNWQNFVFGAHGAPQGAPAGGAPPQGAYQPKPWQPLAPLTMSKPAMSAPFSGNPYTPAPAAPAANPLSDPNAHLSDAQLGTVGDIKIGNLSFRNDADIARFNNMRRGVGGSDADGADGTGADGASGNGGADGSSGGDED